MIIVYGTTKWTWIAVQFQSEILSGVEVSGVVEQTSSIGGVLSVGSSALIWLPPSNNYVDKKKYNCYY